MHLTKANVAWNVVYPNNNGCISEVRVLPNPLRGSNASILFVYTHAGTGVL